MHGHHRRALRYRSPITIELMTQPKRRGCRPSFRIIGFVLAVCAALALWLMVSRLMEIELAMAAAARV